MFTLRRFPRGELVARGRQRLQRIAFELLEQRAARDGLATEAAVIDQRELLGDGRVGFGQREELAFAQRGQNPAFGDLNGDLERRPYRAADTAWRAKWPSRNASRQLQVAGGSAPGRTSTLWSRPTSDCPGTTTRA